MCSSFSVHEAYWIEELFFVLGEQLFWSLSCRECWLPFTCSSSWLCIGSTPPRGASGRSAGGACWGADCTEVAVHCRPVPPAPHTEGRVFPKGKVGAYLSRSGAPEVAPGISQAGCCLRLQTASSDESCGIPVCFAYAGLVALCKGWQVERRACVGLDLLLGKVAVAIPALLVQQQQGHWYFLQLSPPCFLLQLLLFSSTLLTTSIVSSVAQLAACGLYQFLILEMTTSPESVLTLLVV